MADDPDAGRPPRADPGPPQPPDRHRSATPSRRWRGPGTATTAGTSKPSAWRSRTASRRSSPASSTARLFGDLDLDNAGPGRPRRPAAVLPGRPQRGVHRRPARPTCPRNALSKTLGLAWRLHRPEVAAAARAGSARRSPPPNSSRRPTTCCMQINDPEAAVVARRADRTGDDPAAVGDDAASAARSTATGGTPGPGPGRPVDRVEPSPTPPRRVPGSPWPPPATTAATDRADRLRPGRQGPRGASGSPPSRPSAGSSRPAPPNSSTA